VRSIVAMLALTGCDVVWGIGHVGDRPDALADSVAMRFARAKRRRSFAGYRWPSSGTALQ
jgi:hypothetical protein